MFPDIYRSTPREIDLAGPVFCEWLQSLQASDLSKWGCAIASVASEETTTLIYELVADCTGNTPLLLKNTMSMPFESDYAKGEAGIDRLANVAAAIELRLNPCIVIDVGTAVTLEAISAQGCFLGGSIFPGPELASAALAGKAKQLPEIELRAPESAVASDTHHGIQSGVIFGIAGAIDRLIDLTIAEKFYTEKPLEAGTTAVILTGGFAELIAPHLRNGGAIEPNLTLTGVAKIYRSL